MLVRRGTALVPPLLLFLLVLAPGGQAACSESFQGDLTVPTGTPDPPPLNQQLLDGVNVVFVHDIVAGDDYELRALGMTSSVTFLGEEVHFADFNVAWYKDGAAFDTQIVDHDEEGDQSAMVPSEADYGLVYMRYGPDLGTSDQTPRARFILEMGC